MNAEERRKIKIIDDIQAALPAKIKYLISSKEKLIKHLEEEDYQKALECINDLQNNLILVIAAKDIANR